MLSSEHCLVLGGTGFIGSHVVDALVGCGHKVRVLNRSKNIKTGLLALLAHVELFTGDFTNADDLARALEGVSVVVHLISTTTPASSNDFPIFDVETNIAGTVRLLILAKNAGVKKIVFASSGGTVYGVPQYIPILETHPNNPTCSYGITKLAIEKYLHLFNHLRGFDYSILRIANPYGPRQDPNNGLGAITVFLDNVIKGKPIQIWGDGEIRRDYLYIDDLASVFIKVIGILPSPASKIHNIGGGSSHSLNEILAVIRRVTGKSTTVDYTSGRRLDVPVNFLDISRAREELKWEPEIDLENGIELTYKWLIQREK